MYVRDQVYEQVRKHGPNPHNPKERSRAFSIRVKKSRSTAKAKKNARKKNR